METSQVSSDPGLVTVVANGETVPGGGIMTEHIASKFFATKGDNIEKAVEDVKKQQLKPELDGEFIGRWLLTEISFWNRDKERLVVLCENAILVCKYDYVAMKLINVERIQLKGIKDIQSGKFEYPPNSVFVPRTYEGLRISWGSVVEQPWYQKWNPFNQEIPLATFASHPVMSAFETHLRDAYDVHSFLAALKRMFEKYPGITFIDNQPIMIESYAGFVSYVHNQSRLGFSRERGGVSF